MLAGFWRDCGETAGKWRENGDEGLAPLFPQIGLDSPNMLVGYFARESVPKIHEQPLTAAIFLPSEDAMKMPMKPPPKGKGKGKSKKGC